MKKVIALTVGLGLSVGSMACDVCGCRPGMLSGDPLYFSRTSIGLSFQQNVFHSKHLSLFNPSEYEVSREVFRTLALSGKYSIDDRWSLYAVLPMALNTYELSDNKSVQTAIGDVALSSAYIWKVATDESPWVADISLTVKLPTGPWSNDQATSIPANMLPGTGSTDFLLGSRFTYRHSPAFATRLAVAYRMNTTNGDSYHFGNQVNAEASELIRLWSSASEMSGFWFEGGYGFAYDAPDSDGTSINMDEETSGTFHMAKAGLIFQWNEYSLAAYTQIPLAQNFGGGLVEASATAFVQFQVYF